jgi:hypothetical protein
VRVGTYPTRNFAQISSNVSIIVGLYLKKVVEFIVVLI